MHELIIFLTSIECGLLFTLPILAMFISSRILKVDDLTIEGSFGLGGALTAAAIIHGWHPTVAMVLAMAACGIAGAATALIHTRLNLSVLMSGIIVTTALFSVNLKLAGANLSLAMQRTIFAICSGFTSHKVVPLLVITLSCIAGLAWFLTTRLGFFMRATGQNPHMVRTLGQSPTSFITFGLIMANVITGLAGALSVQYVGFFSIWSNVGIMIVTLAGLMLAELISKGIGLGLLCGAIAYQLLLLLTFELQLDPDWNKCITALCIIGLLAAKKLIISKEVS